MARRLIGAHDAYADELVEEDIFQRRSGRRVQREAASDALWRKVDEIEYA